MDTIKVAIVDDNTEFCRLIEQRISEHSELEHVGTVHDGIDAFGLISDKKPDVLILDMIMPQLDGLGVLEKLKVYPLEHKPTIFILSALGQEGVVAKIGRLLRVRRR